MPFGSAHRGTTYTVSIQYRLDLADKTERPRRAIPRSGIGRLAAQRRGGAAGGDSTGDSWQPTQVIFSPGMASTQLRIVWIGHAPLVERLEEHPALGRNAEGRRAVGMDGHGAQ